MVSKIDLGISEVQHVKYCFNCNNSTNVLQDHNYYLYVVSLYNGISL